MCGRFTNQYTWRELHALYMLSLGFEPNAAWKPNSESYRARNCQKDLGYNSGLADLVQLFDRAVGPNYLRDTTRFPVFTLSNDVTRTRYVPVAVATHSNPAKYCL